MENIITTERLIMRRYKKEDILDYLTIYRI